MKKVLLHVMARLGILRAQPGPESKEEAWASKAHGRMLHVRDETKLAAIVSEIGKERSFGGWALSVNALKAFLGAVERIDSPRVLEFGSGVSTWVLDRYLGERLTLDSFEHSAEYAEKIRSRLRGPKAAVHVQPLRQFSDEEFRRIMSGGISAELLRSLGSRLPESRHYDTRVANVFYEMNDLAGPYHAMILDGPHGNGRSVAFALAQGLLADPAYVLIDDCNHYDFVYDCGRFFRFNILQGEILPAKRWVLLQVGKRDESIRG